MTVYEDLVINKGLADVIQVEVEDEGEMAFFYSTRSPADVVVPIDDEGLSPDRWDFVR